MQQVPPCQASGPCFISLFLYFEQQPPSLPLLLLLPSLGTKVHVEAGFLSLNAPSPLENGFRTQNRLAGSQYAGECQPLIGRLRALGSLFHLDPRTRPFLCLVTTQVGLSIPSPHLFDSLLVNESEEQGTSVGMTQQVSSASIFHF